MIASVALPAAARSLEAAVIAPPGSADELRQLQAKLYAAADLAADAEAKQIRRADIREWLETLRDAVYQVGDAADDFRRCGVQQRRENRRSIRHWFRLSPKANEIEYKALRASITSLNQKMDGILQRGSQLDLQRTNHQNLNARSGVSWDPLPHDDMVGDIEDEKMKLIEILTDRQSANVVVTIVGTSGIGKTKLARKIHDDHQTRNAFSIVVWVSVLKDFDNIGLLSAIVSAAGGNPRGTENTIQLEAMLSTILEGKRFLLMLDDVRNRQISENFLGAHLHGRFHRSRVLITTRDESVATQVKNAYIHRVQELTFQDCWSLLCRNALLDENLDGDSLRKIGIMIIQKCNKLPMAIKIIGAVLRTKEQTQEEWQRVYDSEGWSFKDIPKDTNGLIGAIYLGYNDLPSNLKQCFLYFSLFPEGSVIMQRFVTQLWISEGFIEEQDNCNPEKIAEDYYRELVSRNLLQPELGSNDITRCIMHDHIRSVLQFFTKDTIFSGELQQGLRHLWIRKNELMATLEALGTLTSLKTVILYMNPLDKRSLDKLIKGLKYLRVLDLGGTEIKYIPRTLEFLVCLRLLNLSQTRITELPESIEGLRNLEFLGLRYCNWLHCLPNGISKLDNLRNLDLRGTSLHQVLPSLAALKQLSTLHGFVVNCKPVLEEDPSGWPLEDLKSLNALRSLQILKMERVSDCSRAQVAALEMKSHLKELELCCSTDDRLVNILDEDARILKKMFDCLSPPRCLKSLKIVSYYGKRCPRWILNLPNLQRLVLSDCKFCEHLPDLGQLPQLKFLTIIGCSELQVIEQEQAGTGQAFPKLEELHLKDMQNLESWVGFAPGDLPSLVKLYLDGCPKLRYLPSGLKYSTVLTNMQIRRADSLEVFGDLPVLKELVLEANNKLTEVSKLPSLEALIVLGCSSLQDVNQAHHLSHVRIVDRELRKLPDWLRRHALVLQTFSIVGVAELLERLLPNGEDWVVIRDIDKVYANLPDESPFFTYVKRTADFHVDQKISDQGQFRAVPAAGISSGISVDNSDEKTSQIGVPNIPVNQTSTLKWTIKQYLAPYLIIVLLITLSLSYWLQDKTAREIVLIQTLVIFCATIFLLPFLFLD